MSKTILAAVDDPIVRTSPAVRPLEDRRQPKCQKLLKKDGVFVLVELGKPIAIGRTVKEVQKTLTNTDAMRPSALHPPRGTTGDRFGRRLS